MVRTTENITMNNEQLRIRKMTIDDIDDVYKIELQSFRKPWPKHSFFQELTQNKFATYFVIEYKDNIAGYCGLWVVMDDAQITNIAILPDYRGQKLGEKLLIYVKDYAKELGAAQLTLEVRVSNYIAQNLYKKLGFEVIGLRKNYYTDNQEDALLMWVKL
ncbi:ribosomal protein S18-alanine N-acetyltransferase [Bacillus alveayuensis]|uniref:ribosomal protein S18-alanine N-acetyltransferase n=1 Tax=Aeribacillus alveayuensis TaxID=279215 RepID=UPI001F3D5E67|nr:ribosomal protein S18-alanine N-acetyltransferase [Bacillus alveayuensis]